MTWQTRAVRYVSIGEPSARFRDLVLDFDVDGEPVETIVWLPNGGGKSSLISLQTAVVLPAARDFTGGGRDSGEKRPRRLDDYVVTGDTSHTVIEWTQPHSGTLFGDSSRLLTGVVYEWPDRKRPASEGGAELKKLWWSAVPVDSVLDLRTLPVRGEKLLTRTQFHDRMRNLNTENPELQIQFSTSQTDWETHLGKLGIDTSLHRYQARMNRSEGGVVDVFRFNTVKDFIDLVVDVIARPEQGEDCGTIVSGHAKNLFRRPALQIERSFLTEARSLLVELDAAHELVQVATGARDQAHAHALRLRQALRLAADSHDVAAAVAASRAATLRERVEVLVDEQRDVEGVRAELLFLAAAAEDVAAGLAVEAAKQAAQAARVDVGAWTVAGALAEAATHEQSAAELRDQLKPERAARELLRLRVDTVAAAARDLLEHQAADLTREAAEADEADRDARGIVTDVGRVLQATRDAAQEQQRVHTRADLRISDHEKSMTSARRSQVLEPSEAPADAVTRLRAGVEAAAAAVALHEESEARQRAAARTAAHLCTSAAVQHVQLAAEAAAAHTDEQNVVRAHDALATHERLKALAEADDVVRVWGDARRLRAALTDEISEAEAEVLREAVNAAEDDRLVAGVDANGLMPPPAATTAVARTLTTAGVPAETCWHHLTSTYPLHARRDAPADRPDVAAGVVVQDDESRARALVLLATDPALALIALVTAKEVRDVVEGNGGPPSLPAVPLHDGLHVPEAASAAADLLRSSGDAHQVRRAALRDHLQIDQALLGELNVFLRTWPDSDTLVRAARATGAAREAADRKQSEATNQAQRRDDLELAAGEARRLAGEATQTVNDLRGRLARAEALAAADTQMDGHRETARFALAAQEESGGRIAALEADQDRAMSAATRAVLTRTSRERDARDAHTRASLIHVLDPDNPPQAEAVEAARTGGLTRVLAAYEATAAQWAAESGASVLEAKLDAAQVAATEARSRAERSVMSSGADVEEVRSLAEARAYGSTAIRCDDEAATARARLEAAVAAKTTAEGVLTQAEATLVTATSNRERTRSVTLAEHFTTVEDARSRAAELLTQVNDLGVRADAASKDSAVAAQAAQDEERLAESLRDQCERLPVKALEGSPGSQTDLSEVSAFPAPLDAAREATTIALRRLTDTVAEFATVREERAVYTAQAWKLASSPAYASVTLTLRHRLGDTHEEGLGAKASGYVAEIDTRTTHVDGLLAQIVDDERRIADVVAGHVKELLGGLVAAARASVLPDGLGELSGEQFLQLRHDPLSDGELHGRVTQEILSLLAGAHGNTKSLPSGQHLLRQCVHAAAGVKGFRVKVLKPNEHLLVQRVPVVDVARFSDGEKLTTCVLLFCAFARMRQHGRPTGTTGTLMLDNPIGRASTAQLIRLQLAVAQAQRVHLVYATGLEDMGALLQFRRIIRLRNRRPLRSSEGHVQLEVAAGARVGEVTGVSVARPSVPVPAVFVPPSTDTNGPGPAPASEVNPGSNTGPAGE